MNCQEFDRLTESFIEKRLDYRKLNEFLAHDRTCPQCHDDLEIQFLIYRILQNEDETSYNLANALKMHIQEAVQERNLFYRRKRIQGVLLIAADLLALFWGLWFWFIIW